MLYRLTSTPLGCALVRGGLFGGAMGVWDGLRDNSLRSGLVFGLTTGVLFAAFVALEARGRLVDLRGLSGSDRETVVRTVRKGSPVEDVRLAPVIAAHAASLRRHGERTSGGEAFGRLVYGVLALVTALMTVAAIQGDNGAGAVGFGLLAALDRHVVRQPTTAGTQPAAPGAGGDLRSGADSCRRLSRLSPPC